MSVISFLVLSSSPLTLPALTHWRYTRALPIWSEHQHVSLRPIGLNLGPHLLSSKINYRNGIVQFRRYIEQSVRPELGAVRPHRLTLIHAPNESARLQIKNGNRVAVRAGLSNSNVAVDGT